MFGSGISRSWMEAEFIELPNAPYRSFVTPKRMSNSEFVTATDEGYNKLLKFNVMMNSWEELFDYSGWKTCSDKQSNSKFVGLYNLDFQDFVLDGNTCYVVRNEYVVEINMKTNNIKLYANEIKWGTSGFNPVMVFHDDKLHIIGGSHSKKHCIFDTKTKQFTDNHTFQELVFGIASAALIHIKSKNVLYLMGGYDSDQWERQHMDKIWKCSLNGETFSWELLSLKLPVGSNDFPYLLTTNERYILVLLCRTDPNDDSDYSDDETEEKYLFHYLDLSNDENKMVFVKSPLAPTIAVSHMVTTGNYEESRLIIDGYVRTSEMVKDLTIPGEIITVITSYYDEEIVHLFWRGPADDYKNMHHWKINIAKIIPKYYISS